MDEPAQPFLHRCDGREGQRRQLEIRRLQPGGAVQNRMEEGSDAETGRQDHGVWVASERRWQLGTFARDHFSERQQTLLWPPVRHRRRREQSCCGGAMMRSFIAKALFVIIMGALAASAQTPTKSTIPRTSDGKPDLTGGWQGGSTQRGSWEEANRGVGVGGSGRDPSAAVALSSNDRPAGREGAPYQPWAAQKVLEAFNRRGIDDPTSQCLPAGLPRTVMLGLFPQQIVQTPTQIVMLYEYMKIGR